MADRTPAAGRQEPADEVARAARATTTAGPSADAAKLTTGRSRPGLTGHVGHDRRVLRSLQRKAGNAAATSLLPVRVAQPTIQRITDEEKKLLADEELAWNAAQAKVGKEALFVTHENPDFAIRVQERQPETSRLTVGALVDRNGGDPKRKSFDSAGAAAALASTLGGPAIAFKQDRFYFVAGLSGNGGMVRAKVWKVISRFAIDAAIGDDGMRYPLNEVLLLPSQDYAAKFQDATRAETVDAAGMRSVAGVKSDEDIAAETADAQAAKARGEAPPDPKRPERTRIPPERQEAFIAGYFRARAMELLGNNLAQAQKLKKDFQPGNASGDSGVVSANAKALIDSTREQGARMREILEKEALAQRYYELVRQRRSFRGSGWEIVVGGKTTVIALAEEDLKKQIDKVKEDKNLLLSRYPMLALMVDPERKAPEELSTPGKVAHGAAGAARSVGQNVEMLWKSELEKPTLYGRNQYDASSFGKGAGDEELRKEFFEKVVGVETAVRAAMAKVLGEGQYFLYGMAPLRTMVLADLAGNPELKAKAEEILKSHDTWSLVWNILGAAIEFGLMFVPGIGSLLSAAAGVITSSAQLELSMQDWNYSKAAIDPTKALVDQQEASDTLFWDTVFMAAAAADFGAEIAGSLAKGGKALTEEEKAAKQLDARPHDAAKRQKAIREAEEQKFWQPKDVPSDYKPFKRAAKPDAAPLSDGFTATLATVGIKVDAKGVATGDSPVAILGAAKRSWTRVKSALLSGETAADKAMGAYFMGRMVEYRHNASFAILNQCLDEIKARYYKPGEELLDTFEPTGSVSLTSDMDFTVKGPHASAIVEEFNKRFKQRIVDCESAIAFDTNVYTRPAFLDTPFDVPGGPSSKLDPVHDRALIADQERLWKEFSSKARSGEVGPEGAGKSANIDAILAEAERLYPTDFRARMAHVNNFNQETASHIKAADTMLAKGKEGVAEWAAYKQSILAKTPKDNLPHAQAVLQEAEARALSYQDQVLAELNAGRKSDLVTKEQMTKAMAEGPGSEAYERVIAARNRIYERKLGAVSAGQKAYDETRKKFEALRMVHESGKATPEQQAELLRLQSELHARATSVGASQSEALYFASEAHQAQGTFLLIVQNGQKAKNFMESPAYGAILSSQARDACFELLGFVIAHSGATLDDALGAAKNLERANLAYMAHPLAKGGAPAVLGLAGQVVVAKKASPDEALKVIIGRYGPPKESALAAFSRDVQVAGAQLRGQMAKVSGMPVKEIEEAWMRAVANGQAATLLMYASLAASKGGTVDRATH
jgi:hypothetical protein